MNTKQRIMTCIIFVAMSLLISTCGSGVNQNGPAEGDLKSAFSSSGDVVMASMDIAINNELKCRIKESYLTILKITEVWQVDYTSASKTSSILLSKNTTDNRWKLAHLLPTSTNSGYATTCQQVESVFSEPQTDKDPTQDPSKYTAVATLPKQKRPILTNITAIALGGGHACALTSSGGVKCWGANNTGQLGDGTSKNSWVPVDVIGLSSGVRAITAGIAHTCALTSSGGVKCWGMNAYSQLGDGTTDDRLSPVDVVGLMSGVTAITSDGSGGFTCALTSGGGVKCWGENAAGQLGNGTTKNSSVPVDVDGLSTGVSFVAAGGFHACAQTFGNGVRCWGNNGEHELGAYYSEQNSSTPLEVIGLSNGVVALDGGYRHTCVVTSGGGVQCWGENSSGKLGDNTEGYRVSPVDVVGLTSGVSAIAAGDEHTCALTSSGGVKCWGSNIFGNLGDGTTNTSFTPEDVVGLTSGAIAIATGRSFSCALTSASGVMCWGKNTNGQLGNGTAIDSSLPSDVFQ